MPYRKEMDSEAEITSNTPSDDSLVGLSKTEPLDSGFKFEAHKQYLKELIGGLLAAAPNATMKHVQFTWNAPDDCHLSTVADPS